RLAAIRPSRPSRERITTSAFSPRASCAPMVCGPSPWEAPEPVVTLMPLACSNSGSNFSYAPEKPPEIRTFICAEAPCGQISSAASAATAVLVTIVMRCLPGRYGGQIYPVPDGDLKQPTDSGITCLGSHSTTFGK